MFHIKFRNFCFFENLCAGLYLINQCSSFKQKKIFVVSNLRVKPMRSKIFSPKMSQSNQPSGDFRRDDYVPQRDVTTHLPTSSGSDSPMAGLEPCDDLNSHKTLPPNRPPKLIGKAICFYFTCILPFRMRNNMHN